jgi:MFS transporter, Spinster family, sphingosine-1-phosphate transporter
LYYIVTGIQYWVTDYLVTDLSYPEAKVQITFGIVSITGPVLGIIIGGNVSAALGGIHEKKTLYVALFVSLLALMAGVPVPFLTNFWGIIALLWLLLFFGGSLMPWLTGVLLATVPKDQIATANSIANLGYNLIGYLPAPVVYGCIYDAGTGGNARVAMASLMFTTAIPVLVLCIASYYLVRDNVLGYEK